MTTFLIALGAAAIASMAAAYLLDQKRHQAAVVVGVVVVLFAWLMAGGDAWRALNPGEAESLTIALLVSVVFVPLMAFQLARETRNLWRRVPVMSREGVGTVAGRIAARARRAHAPAPKPAKEPVRVASTPAPTLANLTQTARLELARQHFPEFAENSRAGFWIEDVASRKLVYVSPTFETIWGVSSEEFYRDPQARIRSIHREDLERVLRALARARAGEELNEEYRVEWPDGSVRWLWDRGVPIRDRDGQVHRVAGIVEDISQRKGVEEVNLFRANFVANMSHEVRTPLNIMIGYLEFLLDGTFGPLSCEQREVTDRVRKNAEELLDLMSASLDLSRLDNRTIPLTIESVDIEVLIKEIVNDARALTTAANLTLSASVPADLPPLETDRQKLRMILKNLVSNSLKFTQQGSVAVSAAPVANGIEFAVIDTGMGIEADVLPKIFEPFRQGSNHQSGGVGLGLYIVRRLVDILEGRVAVESRLGHGTTFRVWIPR